MVDMCPCGSQQTYASCCYPFIKGKLPASSPEKLMRSRFTAYATGNFAYVLHTYAQAQQSELSLIDLAQDADLTEWLALDVLNAHAQQVTFKAYYRFNKQLYMMHEISDFVLEQEEWRYTSGVIQSDSGICKIERNAPCFCGSGKKYKNCHLH
ncbi:YchJ family protein [Opacimonas viscosa]|uniref:YchJ family metal-binding protein n=1 Tax=Opacimonas viscosa TaxID=2961944 RepID=A0AA41X0D5_9ALTE|nr:YchJ family metal-binding protein [Opacimonas viscosa]MCP3429605.1 YchJ family metal-binding protein [Opacimonas viscosa]